jgi:SAM-dependent methyltransferase
LDYGCGDGHFLRLVKPKVRSVMGYDPWDGANPEGVPFVRDVNVLKTTFDCIVCLEVLEHIPDDLVDRFLADSRRLLKPDGLVVISVPVMIGPAGTFKVLNSLHSEPEYTVLNAARYLLGVPPPRKAFYEGGGMSHASFDYRVLRRKLRSVFRSVAQHTSPFRSLPGGLNSQVFFACREFHLDHRSRDLVPLAVGRVVLRGVS